MLQIDLSVWGNRVFLNSTIRFLKPSAPAGFNQMEVRFFGQNYMLKKSISQLVGYFNNPTSLSTKKEIPAKQSL